MHDYKWIKLADGWHRIDAVITDGNWTWYLDGVEIKEKNWVIC